MSESARRKISKQDGMTTSGGGGETPLAEPAPDRPLAGRLEELPRDVGGMLLIVGFAGFVAPGIFGLPFMLAGGMILWPKTTRRLQRYLGSRAPENTSGMKQIVRFLDDLERRYPKIGNR